MRNLYLENISDSLFFIKRDIIKDVEDSKPDTLKSTDLNFQVNSKYKDYLYNIFMSRCKKLLNNFDN